MTKHPPQFITKFFRNLLHPQQQPQYRMFKGKMQMLIAVDMVRGVQVQSSRTDPETPITRGAKISITFSHCRHFSLFVSSNFLGGRLGVAFQPAAFGPNFSLSLFFLFRRPFIEQGKGLPRPISGHQKKGKEHLLFCAGRETTRKKKKKATKKSFVRLFLPLSSVLISQPFPNQYPRSDFFFFPSSPS